MGGGKGSPSYTMYDPFLLKSLEEKEEQERSRRKAIAQGKTGRKSLILTTGQGARTSKQEVTEPEQEYDTW